MNHKILALAALPALALSACTIIPPAVEQAPPPQSDGFAQIGQTIRVGALTIRPDAINEDSRCPMNARCVWAGRVIVAATVMQNGESTFRNFTLGEPASDGLMLDTVEPGRTTLEGAIPPASYRFHFSITPRQ
ncbi:hypothetical protein GGQ88_002433 [Novosphingobium hassiacum]|uniref:Lipoprotein n=1 Tax=Novosphingobium hassiacum TaxID=173676 RepID=A0A7W5ZX98_9SPHN|nr:hypothetical protein [Novosphingobium hassiacum]MBB3861161.1 hypothetical protein [Novosphingobium hassiacum]